ncbi:hypothetical protein HD554DRAFT_2125907 [Boletus coccyginus]|nr:hypothetical protein HD554DRAFT_2125907 [Boletus coccyginus]
MPGIERCASPEQLELPPLEPLSETNSLHDALTVAPTLSGTLHESIERSPKQQQVCDMGQLMRDMTATLKLSIVLENKGNVARDHLASERTYLAYVRTSLATASAGVALVQLFTLSSTGSVAKFAKPIGATIILFGIIILVLGVFRYFTTQSSLIRGHFPVARNSVTAVALALGSLVAVVFGIVIAGTQG